MPKVNVVSSVVRAANGRERLVTARWVETDGGRRRAGFQRRADDCAARAVAIATGRAYREVYEELDAYAKRTERHSRGRIGWVMATGRGSSAREGIITGTFRRYVREVLGWHWTPTTGRGGRKVYLRDGDLPPGRLLVSVAGHVVAVLDGVIHDVTDCSNGARTYAYGYWTAPKEGDR